VISTGNNYLFSPATSVVHDVLQRFVMKKANDRSLVLMSRIVVVVLGLLALAQSFQPSILHTAVYAYDVYGAGITPVVVAAFSGSVPQQPADSVPSRRELLWQSSGKYSGSIPSCP